MATYSKGTTFAATFVSGGPISAPVTVYTVPAGRWAEVIFHWNSGGGNLDFKNSAGRVFCRVLPGFNIQTAGDAGAIPTYGSICDAANQTGGAFTASFPTWPTKIIMPPGSIIQSAGTGIATYEFQVTEYAVG